MLSTWRLPTVQKVSLTGTRISRDLMILTKKYDIWLLLHEFLELGAHIWGGASPGHAFLEKLKFSEKTFFFMSKKYIF